MAFAPSHRVFQELETERSERSRMEETLEQYRQRCAEYEHALDKLRRREAALTYRLSLAENAQVEAAERLGGAMYEDELRETDALQELQDKVSEMEQIEFQKAQALQEFAHRLRAQTLGIRHDLDHGLRSAKDDLRFGVAKVSQSMLQSFRRDLKSLRAELENEMTVAQRGLKEDISQVIHGLVSSQKEPLDQAMQSMCELLQTQMDPDLLWDAVRLDVPIAERTKACNRFLATCTIPRIALLERSLEQAQNAEARAKRLAVKLAEKHDEEMKQERARSEHLQRKLDQALEALEKTKLDFANISLVLDELTKKNEAPSATG